MRFLEALQARVQRRPVLSTLLMVFILAAITVAAGRVWLSTDGGRRFIESQLNGRQIAGYGTLRVNGLTGDPLSVARLARVTIADGEGVWLEVVDAEIDWAPGGLLRRRIDIASLNAGSARIIHRPVRAPQPRSGDSTWSFHLGRLRLDDLHVEERVAGVASHSSVEGHFTREASGGAALAFTLSPKGSGGDWIDLEATWGGEDVLEFQLEARSPAGGVLGALAGLDPASPAVLRATAAGTFSDAIGEATLQIAGSDAIIAAGKIESGELVATARIDATRLPIAAEARQAIGPGADVAITAAIRDGRATFLSESQLATGEISLDGAVLIADRKVDGPLAIRADLSSLQPFTSLAAGITLEGALSDLYHKPSFEGEVRLVASAPDLPFEAVNGLIGLTWETGSVSFAGELTGRGVLKKNPIASGLIGEAPHLQARGSFVTGTSRLSIEEAVLVMPDGRISGAGEADLAHRTLDVAGTLDTGLGALGTGITGRAKGVFAAKGRFEAVDASATVGLSSLTGLAGILEPPFSDNARLDVAVSITGPAVSARALRFRSDGLSMTASGALAGPGGRDVRFAGTQRLAAGFGGASALLGDFEGRITSSGRGLNLSATSERGALRFGERDLRNMSAGVDAIVAGGTIAGPVILSGELDGTPLRIAGDLSRSADEMRLSGAVGQFGPLRFSGEASQSVGNGMAAAVVGSAENVTLAAGTAREAIFDLKADRRPRAPLRINASATLRALMIEGFGPVDLVTARLTSGADGYDFAAAIKSAQARRPIDLRLNGRAAGGQGTLAGTVSLDGSVLGEPISTLAPARWRAGPQPSFSADLSVLGGRLRAGLDEGAAGQSLWFRMDAIEGRPVFEALGVSGLAATFDGQGRFQPFGETPSGTFSLDASSAVPGLDTSVKLDLDGVLASTSLNVSAAANYGGRLTAGLKAALPMKTAQARLASFDLEGPLSGAATLAGDLSVLRTAAQAFGQDIGGSVDVRVVLGGRLAKPSFTATAGVRDGKYELGLTGLRLTGLDITAGLANGALSVDLTGSGANGGSLRASGEMRPGAGEIKAELTRLLIYEREGNSIRASGPLVLTETPGARLLSGSLTIDEARGSLDSLPSGRARALEVRWRDGLEGPEPDRLLAKPLTIDIHATSPGRIMVSGRGLTSEWGLDVRATGLPTAPILKGSAPLVRGELDLAGRPFVFDRGIVRFDGPFQTARVDLGAARNVDGFSARMAITGLAIAPDISFTSTPALPQDEILSRLLFGRSSINLSALEAAQLAASIARLSGRGSVFDPIGQLQAAIGLDRLSVGVGDTGAPELGAGQFIADSVYLELKSAGASGNAVVLEWEPAPQISVTSETRIDGDTRLSIRWKKDYD